MLLLIGCLAKVSFPVFNLYFLYFRRYCARTVRIIVFVLLIVIVCLYTEFDIISVSTCIIYILCIRFNCIC